MQEPYAQAAETHSAVVFFAGDRAYKLKKPVNLGFLDFSTTRARAAACAREVELNRRYAPDVYLGVAEVRGPDGEVCDHLVVMRRMPESRRLSALVQARAPVTDAVRQVAKILAAQHASAPRGPQIDK
ncbi:MAG TPA: gluconate kinase, partial [Trebonia sp.]|nr:gluconate kinase [Trebonia sp.]